MVEVRLLAERKRDDTVYICPRQLQVAKLVGAGWSNKEIATELNISPRTVQCHIAKLVAPLGISDRTAMVIFLLKRGFLSLDDIPLQVA